VRENRTKWNKNVKRRHMGYTHRRWQFRRQVKYNMHELLNAHYERGASHFN
jgi:hypothetical protein